MSLSEKKEVKAFDDDVAADHVERASSIEEIVDLSGIEATAASKAAWLISITVSLGGFLFGKQQCLSCSKDPASSSSARATSRVLRVRSRCGV